MDDHSFLDLIYSQWSQTTGAENKFWIVEEDTGHWANGPGTWNIWAVDENHSKMPIAQGFENEADADFVAGLHGCIGDLVRRMHSALDEADRADRERDEQEQSIFALAVENDELKQELSQLRRERESWVTRAGDALWKIERPM